MPYASLPSEAARAPRMLLVSDGTARGRRPCRGAPWKPEYEMLGVSVARKNFSGEDAFCNDKIKQRFWLTSRIYALWFMVNTRIGYYDLPLSLLLFWIRPKGGRDWVRLPSRR